MEETTLIRALAAAARAFLQELDVQSEGNMTTEAVPLGGSPVRSGNRTEYDPLWDPPLITPKLRQHGGSEDENRMVTVAFLGALARLNADLGTGATAKDTHRVALRAGYPRGGQDVVGWTVREGRTGAIEVRSGLRYLNEDGHKWLRAEAATLGIELKGDITPIPIPAV